MGSGESKEEFHHSCTKSYTLTDKVRSGYLVRYVNILTQYTFFQYWLYAMSLYGVNAAKLRKEWLECRKTETQNPFRYLFYSDLNTTWWSTVYKHTNFCTNYPLQSHDFVSLSLHSTIGHYSTEQPFVCIVSLLGYTILLLSVRAGAACV